MTMTRIERIHAREVLDSRGRPTVEVEVQCAGTRRPGRAIVPSGASTGRFEALELRDGDARYAGWGVRRSVEAINQQLAPQLLGRDADQQGEIDAWLFQRLVQSGGIPTASPEQRDPAVAPMGANATLGLSLATAYAAAEAKEISNVAQLQAIWSRLRDGQPASGSSRPRTQTAGLGDRPAMPLPMVNMISGGKHAGGNLDFQDYLIMPVGATSYPEALEWIVRVYWKLGKLLTQAGFEGVLVGDEGGYGPKLHSNEQALNFVVDAISAAGLTPWRDVGIALDVASSHFFHDGTYRLAATGDQRLSSADVIDLLANWVERYPIISIEDGLSEDDWSGWQALTQRLGQKVQLVGDDLFVTNSARLRQGIEQQVANSVLIKVNQIGTLTATLETMQLALENDYRPVVSARSGETEDTTIADLVVATGAGQLKVGSVARSERLAKYNQLLRLAEDPQWSAMSRLSFEPR